MLHPDQTEADDITNDDFDKYINAEIVIDTTSENAECKIWQDTPLAELM